MEDDDAAGLSSPVVEGASVEVAADNSSPVVPSEYGDVN